MLQRFTDYVIALLELLETQARSAGAGLVRAGTNLGIALAGVCLVFIALVLSGLALYLALEPFWGAAGAVAATAFLLLLLGGLLLWLASLRTSKK